MAKSQCIIANFLKPTSTPEQELQTASACQNRDYPVLPEEPPRSTCDRPHPHKISSSFPKEHAPKNNTEMVETIYNYLTNCCFYSDVSKYMSFHCLGGAVKENTENRVFAFADKPYLLQIQAWWDDISNAFANQSRNDEYVKWVKDFRLHLSNLTTGSFINFIDQSLLEGPDTQPKTCHEKNVKKESEECQEEKLLALLDIYYGKTNLEQLREVKKKYDKEELFKFQMSIPPKKSIQDSYHGM